MTSAELTASVERTLRAAEPLSTLSWLPAEDALQQARELFALVESALRRRRDRERVLPARHIRLIVGDAERVWDYDELAAAWTTLIGALCASVRTLGKVERAWADVAIAGLDRADALRTLGSRDHVRGTETERSAIASYEHATRAAWPFARESIACDALDCAASFTPIDAPRAGVERGAVLSARLLRSAEPGWALLLSGSDAVLFSGGAGRLTTAREALWPSMTQILFSAAPARASFEFVAHYGRELEDDASIEFGSFLSVMD